MRIDSARFRLTARFLAVAMIVSACSPVLMAAGAAKNSRVAGVRLQGSWNPYPDAPVMDPGGLDPGDGPYDIGGPVSPNASVWHADSLAARDNAIITITDPDWVRPVVEPVIEDGPADPGDNTVWSPIVTPAAPGDHIAPQGGGGSGGGTGGGPVDGSIGQLGEALAWQDSFPAGGTSLSPGQANSLNGNRLATVPLASWRGKRGMAVDLTLFHNSAGSAGTLWGRGWRSSYDIEIVQGSPATNPRRCTAIFGDGSAIPFVATRPEAPPGSITTGEMLYSPPVGFYDVLTRFGGNGNGGWYLRRRDGSLLTFNGYGLLVSIRDERNNTVTIGRGQENGPMTSVSDSSGRQLVFTLSNYPSSLDKFYSKVVDPAGREWKFDIAIPNGSSSRVGDLRSVALPKINGANAIEAPTKIEWTYNAFGAPQILTEKDPMGSIWTYTYDYSTGRLKTVKDPLNKTTTYATGTTATMTTPRGAVWTHTYQGETIAAEKDPVGFVESYHYDLRRNRDGTTDRNGKVWRSTYDAFGNAISSQSPEQYALGKSQTLTYNGWNVLTLAKSARNGTTTITPEGNDPKVVVDPDGKTVVNDTFDSYGQTQTAVSSGVSASAAFDSYGRLTSATTADGTSTVAYADTLMAAIGLPSSVTIPGRGTRGMTYDRRGRVIGTDIGAPDERTFVLDALGRPIEIWDDGNKTSVEYDAMSRVKKVTNPRFDVEQYTYNDDGQLTDILRGNGAGVHYTVELRGDVSWEWDGFSPWNPYASGYLISYAFDGEGNIIRSRQGSDSTVNTYTADGQLKTVTHPGGFVESYLYDEDGNRKTMIDRSGTTTWTYSLAGRPLTMSSPAGNVAYTYDAYGNAASVSSAAPGVTPGPSGQITTTRSYPSGQVTSYGNASTNVFASYLYDSYGRMDVQATQTGLSTQYGFDGWGRVASIVHKNINGATIRSESYTYEGTRVKTRTVGSATTTYAYDVAGQLASETRPGYSASYTYDHNGNRLTRTVNGSTDTYSYTGDRLDSISRTGGATKMYTYDALGRPETIKGWDNVYRTLAWNDEDRLTSAPNILAGTQVYNGDGARVSRNGVPYRRAGSSVTSPVLNDGPNRSLVPGVAERTGTTDAYLLADRLGTNALTIEPTGVTVPPAVETDAFGLQLQTPSGRSRWNWNGASGYYDEDGGAYLVGHRWYDADAGRFLTRDPIRAGRNWWVYCDGDPINMIDPEGLDGWDDAANFFGGWGDSMTFGLTGAISQAINRGLGNGEFEYGGGWFVGGQVVGTAHSLALSMGGSGAVRGVTSGVRSLLSKATGRLSARGFTSAKNLAVHFGTHGAEVGAKTVQEYARMANRARANMRIARRLEWFRDSTGADHLYNPATKEFLQMRGSRIISYYKKSAKKWASDWDKVTSRR